VGGGEGGFQVMALGAACAHTYVSASPFKCLHSKVKRAGEAPAGLRQDAA
jgi:hypothetical protein